MYVYVCVRKNNYMIYHVCSIVMPSTASLTPSQCSVQCPHPTSAATLHKTFLSHYIGCEIIAVESKNKMSFDVRFVELEQKKIRGFWLVKPFWLGT